MERNNPNLNNTHYPQASFLDLTYGTGDSMQQQQQYDNNNAVDEYNVDTYDPDSNEPPPPPQQQLLHYGVSNMMDHDDTSFEDTVDRQQQQLLQQQLQQQPYTFTNGGGGASMGSDENEDYDDEDDEDEDQNNRTSTSTTTVEHTGRWTKEEHEAFLQGLQKYGKEWKKVAAKVRTRTVVQTRTHAQKYFQKLQKTLLFHDPKVPKRNRGVTVGFVGTDNDMDDDEGRDVDDENDTSTSDTMKMIAIMSQQQSGITLDIDDIPNVAAFTSTLSSTGSGRGRGRGRGGRKRSNSSSSSKVSSNTTTPISTNISHSTMQPLLPPSSMIHSKGTPQLRRGSAATMNAAQVISTLSFAKTGIVGNNNVTAMSSNVNATTTPSRYHGFSMDHSNTNTTSPWQQSLSSSSKMKIVAPDPSARQFQFPEPSPAATGKRKLAEIAAAQMLAGVIAGTKNNINSSSGATSSQSMNSNTTEQQRQYNFSSDGPPTPPISMTATAGRPILLKDAPPLPPLFSASCNNYSTGFGKSLHIVNPESLGVTIATQRSGRTSPVTPWDGELEALIESTNHNNTAVVSTTAFDEGGLDDNEAEKTDAVSTRNMDTSVAKGSDGGSTNTSSQLSSKQHPIHGPVDGYDRNPLHQAVCARDEDTVQTLIEVIGSQSKDLNQTDTAGYTPLHSACAANMITFFRNNSDIDNNTYQIPSETATMTMEKSQQQSQLLFTTPPLPPYERNSIVRMLLAAGCDPLLTDHYGNTPLHWAVRACDYDASEQLLTSTATISTETASPTMKVTGNFRYVDVQNHCGESCFHWALRVGMRCSHIVSLLLSHSACPYMVNDASKRPIDVASEGFVDDENSVAYARTRQSKGSSNSGSSGNTSLSDGKKKQCEKELKDILKRTLPDRCATRAHLLQHSTRSRTLVLHHPECLDHHPKSVSDWETPDRVKTILQRINMSSNRKGDTKSVDPILGNDRSSDIFPNEITLSQQFDRANLELLSRVHSTEYLSFVNQLSKDLERSVVAKEGPVENDDALDNTETETTWRLSSPPVVPFTPMVQRSMIKVEESSVKLSDNSDTSFSVGSLRAARRAAGAVQHAVDWYVCVPRFSVPTV
jgi:SHAQKYF class myb-like DNA-binding protein